MHLFTRAFLVLAVTSSFTLSANSADTFHENSNEHEKINTQTILTSVVSVKAAKASLIKKLKNIHHFSSDFTQQVFDNENNILQQGAGTIVVSKPNKVHWQTVEPEESLIISDGETLWLFDPFIEQASAFSLENSVTNTPILLLTNESPDVWDEYKVSEIHHDTFEITSLSTQNQSQVKTLIVSFNAAEISYIQIHDITGQRSDIKLSNTDYTHKPNSALFTFTVPEGVYLDDQR